MKLTKKADYALRAVFHITQLPEGKLASIGQIAEGQRAPREFLAKILKQLTKVKILRSYQGIHGGYQLARNPKEISFLDVIEGVEGPISLNQCCRENLGCCDMYADCQMRYFWKRQQDSYLSSLANETMDRYIKSATIPAISTAASA